MAATITHSAGTITPAALSKWSANAETKTVVHDILNRAAPDITFRPVGLRRGTLTLTFSDGSGAYAARAVLVLPEVFTLNHDVVAQVGMSFVVAGGDIGDVLEDARNWTLTVPFVEVSP